ncbi:hypothetical protein VNO77_03058 [Canavalia gladiata]|uniref:Uncharacterized protein n=1 Tax=Canavalia gladiata TaxID=3824 RepID=A0AAN9MZ22_CANGL
MDIKASSRAYDILSRNNYTLQRFRQYGLWERYAESYPDKDLIYTVGVSDYTTDWVSDDAIDHTKSVGGNNDVSMRL